MPPSATIAPEPEGATVRQTRILVPNASASASALSENERRASEQSQSQAAQSRTAPVAATPEAKPVAEASSSAAHPKAQNTQSTTPQPRPARDPVPPPPDERSYPPPDDSGTSRVEDDEDSDLVAPQLVAVEFNPPTVQDGETTMLAITAQDNRSGVRSVSGVIAGPTGTVQGFACQREGDSNRYVTRISIPKEAAAGYWTVKYLTLSDNASNSVNLNGAQGALPVTARFQVVASASDTTAPSLKAIWLDRPAMRAGDRNTVFVQADDDKTGVSIVSGVFVSPGKQARLAFGCRLGTTGAWECPLTPPACLDCGVWRLEQLQMQDKANNMTTLRSDNALITPVVVDISGDACDANPPALSSLALDPLVVSNTDGGTIQVRATIGDEGCGVASLSGQAVPQGNVGGQHAYFSMQPAGDGRSFVGTLTIEKMAAKGTWTIAWLQALDKGHNLRAYSANDPIISRVTFRVE